MVPAHAGVGPGRIALWGLAVVDTVQGPPRVHEAPLEVPLPDPTWVSGDYRHRGGVPRSR